MEPGIIKKLDEAVVNRIAAGEIIQRPANALKEMIENSLDAKSTTIQVTVKSGGLKLLQIQDNGTGIRREDMEIVCERFTTSKLKEFTDLTKISTYGFRGEALASISHVAHLTIQTKTKSCKCAYRASYEDGKLKGEIKMCAGNQGTQITVEDLFFNVPQRRQALKGINEEYQKVYEVVCKYAVHNAGVGFILKKFGENNALRTTINASHLDNIRIVYGNAIAKELTTIEHEDETLQFKIKLFLTKVNYSMKKSIYLFFINHRLVDSANMKSAIEEVYSRYLAKGTFPFVYLSLELNPNNVDVNVHPTKHEVHFLHEDEIIAKISGLVETKFLDGNEARTLYTQARLPGASEPTQNDQVLNKTVTDKEKVYAKDMVRTDSSVQKLDKFFMNATLTQETRPFNESNDSIHCIDTSQEITSFGNLTQPLAKTGYTPKSSKIKIETKLSSVHKLRKAIANRRSNRFREILGNLTFVGAVNRKQALIQHETLLYLCDTQKITEELFYQLLLFDFRNFEQLELESDDDSGGLSLHELAMIYLDSHESEWTEEDGEKTELADRVVEILISKSVIMQEYFGLKISDDGKLMSLPILIENHRPCLAYLPRYIVRLATEVNWDLEIECFDTFAQETAYFYSRISATVPGENEWNWAVEFVLYPMIKRYLLPSKNFTINKCLLQVANLSNLYKVFERC